MLVLVILAMLAVTGALDDLVVRRIALSPATNIQVAAASAEQDPVWLVTSSSFVRLYGCADPLCLQFEMKSELTSGVGIDASSPSIIWPPDNSDNVFLLLCYLLNDRPFFAALTRSFTFFVGPVELNSTHSFQRCSVVFENTQMLGAVLLHPSAADAPLPLYRCWDKECFQNGTPLELISYLPALSPLGTGNQFLAVSGGGNALLSAGNNGSAAIVVECDSNDPVCTDPVTVLPVPGLLALVGSEGGTWMCRRSLQGFLEIRFCPNNEENNCQIWTPLTDEASDSSLPFLTYELRENESLLSYFMVTSQTVAFSTCGSTPQQCLNSFVTHVSHVGESVTSTSVALGPRNVFLEGILGFASTSDSVLIIFNITVPPPVVVTANSTVVPLAAPGGSNRVNLLGGALIDSGGVINGTARLALLGGDVALVFGSPQNTTVTLVTYLDHFGTFNMFNVSYTGPCHSQEVTPNYGPQSLSVTVTMTPCTQSGGLGPGTTSPALSTGVIGGIAAGAVLLGALLVLSIVCFAQYRKKQHTASANKRIKANDLHDIDREKERIRSPH